MDSFILIINLKYFHLPITNNRLVADTKHAFLSLAVKATSTNTLLSPTLKIQNS